MPMPRLPEEDFAEADTLDVNDPRIVLRPDGYHWLSEGGRSNVFLRIDGEWLTPPVGRGVLPGTMRAAVLDDAEWSAREQALRVEDLFRAERIVLTNALRGVLEARLASGEAERFRQTTTETAPGSRG